MTRITLGGGSIDEVSDEESAHRICQDPVRTWERLWLAAGERFNPIFVKEVRQSLKSQQFELSFGLTLLAAIAWTFIVVAMSVPRIYYIPGGVELLNGYAVILLVPLMIVIPFAAFRSLTTEIEDSTFDLLSISSLSAKQIVTGKMATAALQVLLYTSALAPCIVLTYMLRGVSLVMVSLLLGTAIAYSLMLISCALLMSTVSRTRSGQSGMSVLLLSILVISFFVIIAAILDENIIGEIARATPNQSMVIVIIAVVTVLWAMFSLLMQTAAAAIDFPSENKSTPIRKRMLVLLAVLVFWLQFGVLALNEEARLTFVQYPLKGVLIGYFIVWTMIGGLVCGERGIISPRARRSLPETFVGRVMLTWLSPGAGLGYVFMVTVFASVSILLAGLSYLVEPRSLFSTAGNSFSILGVVLTCYFAFYVGLCRLLMLGIGRRIAVPMVASVSLLIVLYLLIHLIPYFLAAYWNDFSSVTYDWHQTFNVILTVEEVTTGNWTLFLANLVALALASIVVFGLNLLLSTRDVMIVRLAAPPRVELELHPFSAATRAASEDPFGP